MDKTAETRCRGLQYSVIEEHDIVRGRDLYATVRVIQLQQ